MTPEVSKTPLKPKAFIYSRCSTIHQTQNGLDSLTIDAQIEKCKSYADFMDLEVANIYSDVAISGKKQRDNFNECVEQVIKNKGTLIIYSLSRASRKTKDLIELSEKLNKHGCQIVSISEKIDTSSAIGKYFFTTLSALAQLEADQVSERTKNSLNHKKQNGLVYSNNTSFGYKKQNGKVIKCDHEQKIITLVKDLRSTGKKQREIVELINEKGYRNRKNGKFNITQIQRMLKVV